MGRETWWNRQRYNPPKRWDTTMIFMTDSRSVFRDEVEESFKSHQRYHEMRKCKVGREDRRNRNSFKD